MPRGRPCSKCSPAGWPGKGPRGHYAMLSGLRAHALMPATRLLLKPFVPEALRWRLVLARLHARRLTASGRVLPDLLVIGAQRSGTSSLYRYLGAHPNVVAPVRKEVGYFTRRYSAGECWYRAHFPLAARGHVVRALGGRRPLAFEATPDYLVHPLAAERAASLLPEAKVVVLLRDPVERAFSHYRHMVRLGFETLPLEAALDQESERLADDLLRLEREPGYDPKQLLRFSYMTRGLYAVQLRRWLAHYPADRLLVLDSAELFSRPGEVYGELLRFLGLPSWAPRHFANASGTGSASAADAMTPAVRHHLEDRFAGPDAALAELLGRDVSWRTGPHRP